jgi:hypothetical protein
MMIMIRMSVVIVNGTKNVCVCVEGADVSIEEVGCISI